MPRTTATPARSSQRAPQRSAPRTALNRYDVDKRLIPQGMSYEWKAVTVAGQEHTEHIINTEMAGWTAVPATRHPELAGRSVKSAEATIVRGGLMLMERPKELTDEAKELDSFAAKDQVATQFARLKLDAKQAGAGRAAKIERSAEAFVPDE